MLFPVLAVEQDFIHYCEDKTQLEDTSAHALLFVLDSRHDYFDNTGEKMPSQWHHLRHIAPMHLANEGHCCVSKLDLQDETPLWNLVKEGQD